MPVQRRTVDLSGYPDLVVVYLGMRVNALAGLKTLLGFGPKIERSPAVDARGGMFSARKRLVAAGARDASAGDEPAAVVPETDLSAR